MEQQLVALASRLRDAGVALTYVFARPPAAFPGEELRDLGVDVRALDFSRPAQAAARLAGWLHESRPQIVHFHFVDAYSPLVLAAKLSGAKVAVHDHLCIAARTSRWWGRGRAPPPGASSPRSWGSRARCTSWACETTWNGSSPPPASWWCPRTARRPSVSPRSRQWPPAVR